MGKVCVVVVVYVDDTDPAICILNVAHCEHLVHR